MPRVITFDDVTSVTIQIIPDLSGGQQHQINVTYAWLADNGETRDQPPLDIYPWLKQNNPGALHQIATFYQAVVSAIMERDGLT